MWGYLDFVLSARREAIVPTTGNTNGAPRKDRRSKFQKTFMETGANPVKGVFCTFAAK